MSDFDKAFDILESENVDLVPDQPIQETLSSPTFEPSPTNFDQVFADVDFTATLEPSTNAPLRATFLDATKQNPDKYAEAVRLSNQSGVPAPIVAPSLEEFKQQAAFDKLDINAMARDFSVTAGFFEDHSIASQFHDDVDTFTGVEQWLREKGNYLGSRFERGQVNVELSGLQARNVYNLIGIPGGTPLTESEIERVDHLHNLQTAITHEDDQGQFFKAVGAASEQIPNYIAMANAGAGRLAEGLVTGAAAGATAAVVGGQLGPQALAPEEIVTVPAGAVAGGLLGIRSMVPVARASVMKQVLDLETGSSFDEFSRFKDEDGNEIDQQTAAYASIAYGTVAAALEGFSLSKVGKVFSGSKKLFNSMLKQRVKNVLRSKTARDKLIELGRNYAVMVGSESITEGLQQGAQTLFGEFAKFADKESFTEQDINQVLDNVFSVDTLDGVIESAVEGARASAVIGAFGTATTVAINGVKAETQNIAEQRKIDELAEISQNSKAVKRNRDDVRRFVEQASTEDDVVYVPAERLQEYLQENDIDAVEDPAFKFIAEQIDDAAALGGDVLIPIPDFVANVADSDHFDALRPHMRLSADSLTPFESQTESVEHRDYVASLMSEAESNADTFQESQQVYESVKQQLIDTGRVTDQVAKISAQIIPAWAAVMSERTGKSVQQVYTESGLAIEGPFVEKQVELAERVEGLSQEGIETLHEVRDFDKIRILADDMRKNGWMGRPIVVVDEQAITGTHRLAAAEEADIDAELFEISSPLVGQVSEEEQLLWGDLIEARDDFDRLTAAKDLLELDAVDRQLVDLIQAEVDAIEDPNIFRQEARGFFDPETNLIRLTEASDMSTFLHESAHFFLEMEKQFNPEGMSPINEWFKRNAGEVAKEANRYLKQEAGISEDLISSDHIIQFIDTGSAGADEINSAIIRATHEQFARGFETYLMEGKAPSLELREAFRAFARWLTDLYRKMRGDLRVNLDDEMRQVLDRMLATEDQINTAEAVNRYQPLFTDAAMAGMTEEAFEAYQKKAQSSTDKANETLRDKILKELTRQTESWWKDEKAERAERITEELINQRVYRAIGQLRDKESQIKMDRVMVRNMLGVDKIPPAFRNMTVTGAGGVTPDDAAAFLGYNSGSEMLNDILDARSIKEVANEQAEAEMKVEHGDILNDGTLDEQAHDAAHNEERGRAILQEMKQLAKGQQRPTIDRATIKQLAAENIGRLPLNKIRPAKYRRAEIKAAQAAQSAMDNNDRGAALRAKTQQAMNFYLWRSAVDAQLEGEKIVRFTRKFSKKTARTALAKAGNGYLDQIDGILARFQFRGSVTAAQEKRDSIETWAAQRAEDGDNIQLTKEVLAETFRMHYKEIPFDQLKGVRDSLKNLDHVARFANKIKREEELIEFQEVKKEWLDHLDNLPDKFTASRADIVTGGVVKKFNWSISQMTKIPFLASWLDGGERIGLSHDLMIQPITDATQQEQRLWNQVGKKVMDAINGRSKEDVRRHNTKLFIPEIDDHLFGHQLISVALNTGNRSNLEKMLKGEGWVTPDATDEEISVNNPQLQAVLRHMSESDWQLVDLIWRQIDELFPLMAEVHKKTSGLTLAKVDAQKVDTSFGEFRGGYYPIKYDPLRSKRASDTQDKIDEQTQSMFGDGGFIKPTADTGAKIERTQYFAPIRFSLDVVPNHIQEVIHYITHFDSVRQIHKLTNDPEISDKIVSKIGRDEYRQIKPWLNDIAKDGREAPSKTFFEEILRRLRFGTTLGMMGFKASTGVIQISGLSNTYAEVGAKYANRGLRHVVGSPQTMKDAWKFASENSKIMENRVNTMDREVRNAMQKIEGKRGLLATTQEVSMKHIALVQTYMVDLPSWYAGYYKGIDEAKVDLNAENFNSMSDYNDAVEKKATQRADWVVENVQGSGLTKDLPAIMRNQSESNRMFTMFFTFFSSLWNMERDVVRGTKAGRYSATTLAAKVMFLFMIPVAFEMAMRGQLSDDDDDDRSAWERYLTGLALYPVQSVPFIRDVVNGVSGEYKFQLTPLAGIIEQGLKGAPKVSEALLTDEELSKGSVKGASKLIGAWFGIPGVSQAWNSSEHLEEVIADGEEFTVRELLFGPDRGK